MKQDTAHPGTKTNLTGPSEAPETSAGVEIFHPNSMKKPMFITTFLLLYVAAVDCMCPFPRECVEGVTDFPVPCCPYFNGTRCGSGDFRGNCVMVKSSRTDPPKDITVDERHGHPSFFFNYICQCKPNFMGHNCGECSFGWTGDRCDKRHMVVREDIMKKNETALKSYLMSLHYCKTLIDPDCVILRTSDRFRERSMGFMDGSYWEMGVFAHYYATSPFLSNGQETYRINFAHYGTVFLGWHRLYLLYLERQMQKCTKNKDFALAYWAWENDPGCAICENNYFGSNGWDGTIDKLSAFSGWRIICPVYYPNTVCIMENCPCERPRLSRSAGLSGFTKANLTDMNRCLDMPNIDTRPYTTSSIGSLRNCIEDNHNGIHLYLGGAMSQVPLSANDPCFSAHHANVDRWTEKYYRKKNITPASYPTDNTNYGHGPSDCIVPFLPCWKNKDMMQTSNNFGYTYDEI